MSIELVNYNKKQYKNYLLNNDIGDDVINNFNKLPESIIVNDEKYELYISCVSYNETNKLKFELNYYSEDKMEFIFNLKVFDEPEISINNLLSELKNI